MSRARWIGARLDEGFAMLDPDMDSSDIKKEHAKQRLPEGTHEVVSRYELGDAKTQKEADVAEYELSELSPTKSILYTIPLKVLAARAYLDGRVIPDSLLSYASSTNLMSQRGGLTHPAIF